MKRWIGLFVPLALIVLSACGGGKPDMTTPIKVEVQTEPAEIQAGQAVELRAVVTQGDDEVDDADEVLFEIWPEGADEFGHEEVEGEHDGDGVYTIDYTFAETGKYFVVAHVTARTFHAMPKIEITVAE